LNGPISFARLAQDVVLQVAKNTAMGVPVVRSWRLRRPRAGAAFDGKPESLERFAFLGLRALWAVVGDVRGLRIAEIGPGDYLTSGLALLAAGAKTYTAIDRFPGAYGGPEAKSWYRGIRDAWPRTFPDRAWPDDLEPEAFPESYPHRVETIARPIEAIAAEERFDLVCSFQVGEHVTDLHAFARVNAKLLVPGGTAIHRVDFGPHDCWCRYDDPMTFLRFPEWLWRLMGSHRGTPNRFRHHEFLEAFDRAGLTPRRPPLTDAFDVVRPAHLARRFKEMPVESLRVQSAIYVYGR